MKGPLIASAIWAALLSVLLMMPTGRPPVSPPAPTPHVYSDKRDCLRGEAMNCDLYEASPEGWLKSFRDV